MRICEVRQLSCRLVCDFCMMLCHSSLPSGSEASATLLGSMCQTRILAVFCTCAGLFMRLLCC